VIHDGDDVIHDDDESHDDDDGDGLEELKKNLVNKMNAQQSGLFGFFKLWTMFTIIQSSLSNI